MRIRSTGLALFAGLSIFVAACSNGTASTSPAASAAAPTTAAVCRRVGPGIRAGIGRSEVGPEDRRRHRRRHGQRQELQRVHLRRRPAGCRRHRCRSAARSSSRRPMRTTRRSSRRSSTRTSTSSWRRASTSSRPRRPRPRPTLTSGSSASTTPRASTRRATVDPTFADCSGDIGDAAAEVHRDQLRRGPGGLPRRHRRRPGHQDRHRSARSAASRCAARASAICRATSSAPSRSSPTSRSSRPSSRTATSQVGFADQAAGKTFGDQFLTQNKGIDVLFQVAGLTGNGVIDAACAAEHQRHRRRRRPARVVSGLGCRAS